MTYHDAQARSKVQVTDAVGRIVEVAAPADRVIILFNYEEFLAAAGPHAFVDLVAPHVGRMLVGEDHRYLFPMSALCGALFLSAASVVSKTIVTGAVFPIGIVTALVGVPFFFFLVLRAQRGYW